MRKVGIAPALFVLALAVTGCIGGCSKEDVKGAASSTLESPSVAEFSEQTREFNGCADGGDSSSYGAPPLPGGCIALTPLPLNHPKYGEGLFAVGLTAAGEEISLAYWFLDSDGIVLQVRTADLGGLTYELTAPKLDGSGNIIFSYNPGRSDGCVALQPNGDWFEGFGTDPMTAPDPEVPYGTRFYGCDWVDEDQDGTMEILFLPSGSGAYDETPPEMFAWNGADYASIGTRSFPSE